MRKLPENLAQGQAGVYTVAAQLLLRGHNPCLPAVDIGADIVLDSGVKVQVKSALTREVRSYENRWDLLDQYKQEIDALDGAVDHIAEVVNAG